jgi:hypothetical protein
MDHHSIITQVPRDEEPLNCQPLAEKGTVLVAPRPSNMAAGILFCKSVGAIIGKVIARPSVNIQNHAKSVKVALCVIQQQVCRRTGFCAVDATAASVYIHPGFCTAVYYKF